MKSDAEIYRQTIVMKNVKGMRIKVRDILNKDSLHYVLKGQFLELSPVGSEQQSYFANIKSEFNLSDSQPWWHRDDKAPEKEFFFEARKGIVWVDLLMPKSMEIIETNPN